MLLPTKARRFPSSARSLPVHAVALVAVLGAAPPVTAAAQSGAATTTAVPLGGLFSTSVPTARGAIGFRFVNVTQAGTLTVSAVAQHPLGAPVVTLWLPLTVTVSTTATFDEVRICVPYAPSELPAGLVPARLNLWRSEAGSTWYPRERADDGSVPEVCGTVGAAALAVIGIGGLPVDVEQWVPSGGSQALQTSRGVVTLNLSGWTGGWLTVGAASSDPAQYGGRAHRAPIRSCAHVHADDHRLPPRLRVVFSLRIGRPQHPWHAPDATPALQSPGSSRGQRVDRHHDAPRHRAATGLWPRVALRPRPGLRLRRPGRVDAPLPCRGGDVDDVRHADCGAQSPLHADGGGAVVPEERWDDDDRATDDSGADARDGDAEG